MRLSGIAIALAAPLTISLYLMTAASAVAAAQQDWEKESS